MPAPRRARGSKRDAARDRIVGVLVGVALSATALACSSSEPTAVGSKVVSRAPVRNATFSFVVIGDFGTGEPAEEEVARAVRAWHEERGVDALVTTGDNVYESGHPRFFGDAWAEPYGWVGDAGLDVIASLGNHDIRTADGRFVMELLEMPDRWYSVVVGDAEVFVLDANRPESAEQAEWLRGALAASRATWKIVVFHHPAFSCSKHDGEPEVQSVWVPLFEREGVDLVLNGHDHNYQRFSELNGVTYVVTGGGGNADLYDIEDCPAGYPRRVVANDDDHHFVAVEGSARRVRLRSIATDGDAIDDVALDRAS